MESCFSTARSTSTSCSSERECRRYSPFSSSSSSSSSKFRRARTWSGVSCGGAVDTSKEFNKQILDFLTVRDLGNLDVALGEFLSFTSCVAYRSRSAEIRVFSLEDLFAKTEWADRRNIKFTRVDCTGLYLREQSETNLSTLSLFYRYVFDHCGGRECVVSVRGHTLFNFPLMEIAEHDDLIFPCVGVGGGGMTVIDEEACEPRSAKEMQRAFELAEKHNFMRSHFDIVSARSPYSTSTSGFFDDACLRKVADTFNAHVKVFKFRGRHATISRGAIEYFLDKCPNLAVFWLPENHFSDDMLLLLARKCPRLEDVETRRLLVHISKTNKKSNRITASGLIQFAKECKTLKKLHLEFCRFCCSFTRRDLKSLFRTCSLSIEKICLEDFNQRVDSSVLKVISRRPFANLKRVRLYDKFEDSLWRFRSKGVSSLQARFPRCEIYPSPPTPPPPALPSSPTSPRDLAYYLLS